MTGDLCKALRVLYRKNSVAMSARLNSLSNIYCVIATSTRRLLPRATRHQVNTTLKFVELEGNRIGRNGGEVGGAEVSQHVRLLTVVEDQFHQIGHILCTGTALNIRPSVILCFDCCLRTRTRCVQGNNVAHKNSP